jgi:hypothetical protein
MMTLRAFRPTLMMVRRSPVEEPLGLPPPPPRLVRLDHAVLAFGALGIDELAVFLVDVICIFYLDVLWEFYTHCYIHIFIEWIKEVIMVVV